MSSSTLPKTPKAAQRPNAADAPAAPTAAASESIVKEFAEALASLTTTVWLFAALIFLILAGTLAQTEKEIWQVVDQYFRTFITWIDFQLFFPASFFPDRPQVSGGFYFPGGWSLGLLLALNLVAAHSARLRPQARGRRLAAGLGMIGLGVLITWLVIAGGAASEFQTATSMSWTSLWRIFLLGLFALYGGLVWAVLKVKFQRPGKRWAAIAALAAVGAGVVWIISRWDAGRFDDSSMRILWQLSKGAAAGAVLFAGCYLIFRKRAGTVLLHGGIGLLMFSELLVGLTAVEAKMRLSEGETVNYVENLRHLELAVVDSSGADADDVVVVPQSLMTPGSTVHDQNLPFDVRVEVFYKNSALDPLPPGSTNLATAGLGLQWAAREVRPVSGTDADGKVDQPAAYVTLLDKQNSEILGTHLVSLAQSLHDLPEKVTVGDKDYKVSLRFKRLYKPYEIRLIDVRKDDYVGTDTPRNYSSRVALNDPQNHVERELNIWMNNPLRYAGETYYQSGYFRDPTTGVESTTLQVVTNTGWMIPYVACMIVALGMLGHFSIALTRYLQRRGRGAIDPTLGTGAAGRIDPATRRARGVATWAVPVAVVLIAAVWVAGKTRLPAAGDGQFQLYEFGKIPVAYQGRVKPLDTMARNMLRILSNRQTCAKGDGTRLPAIRWLLDVIVQPESTTDYNIFRIEHPDLLNTLGLEPRDGFRYSYAELRDHLDNIAKQTELARQQDPARLSVYQKKFVELNNKIGLYEMLVRSFARPEIRLDPEHHASDMLVAATQKQILDKQSPPLAIPPAGDSKAWASYLDAYVIERRDHGAAEPSEATALASWNAIRDAYAADDAPKFNHEVQAYLTALATSAAPGLNLQRTNFEAYVDHLEPFYLATVLYLFAFLLTAVSWLGWTAPLNRAAFWLVMFTFVLHTLALAGRIYISGRPPVTNLYSSAIFIGWGAVLFGLVLEYLNRIGIGNVIASTAGFATLLIAHFLAGDGDTMAVLQAVLDTQFWLATHVVCISLGYATTYVAGLLGILYVLRGVATPTLNPRAGKELVRMIYGTLCFATFFSFVGTVLGGLWADDSWGRFWGWDPKENGALMIVLWNALILHARWGKLVQDRGFALLAVAGNIAVSWSWFGVNELGVGLHSYGFTDGVLRTLGIFVASQLAIIILGLLPKNWWWSRRRFAGQS